MIETTRTASTPTQGALRDFVRTLSAFLASLLAARLAGVGLELSPGQEMALAGALTVGISALLAALGKRARDLADRDGGSGLERALGRLVAVSALALVLPGCAMFGDRGPAVFGRGCGFVIEDLVLDPDHPDQKVRVEAVAHAGLSEMGAETLALPIQAAANVFGGAQPAGGITGGNASTGCADLGDLVRALRMQPAAAPEGLPVPARLLELREAAP